MHEGFRRIQSGTFIIFEGQSFHSRSVRAHLKLNESEIYHHRILEQQKIVKFRFMHKVPKHTLGGVAFFGVPELAQTLRDILIIVNK